MLLCASNNYFSSVNEYLKPSLKGLVIFNKFKMYLSIVYQITRSLKDFFLLFYVVKTQEKSSNTTKHKEHKNSPKSHHSLTSSQQEGLISIS